MMAAILLAAGVVHRHHEGHRACWRRWPHTAVSSCRPRMARHLPFVLGLCRCRSACCSIPTRSTSARCRWWPRSASTLGVPPIQIGQAALLGQMTTGFPVSPLTPATFLVVGLTGIELGEHQRFTGPVPVARIRRHDHRLRPVRSVPVVK